MTDAQIMEIARLFATYRDATPNVRGEEALLAFARRIEGDTLQAIAERLISQARVARMAADMDWAVGE